MRARALLVVMLAALLAGCGGQRRNASATSAELSPLAACESREITLDGADVLLTSNADSSLASVHVRGATNDMDRRDVLKDVYRTFGAIRIDTSVIARTSKWGLTTWTDRCGRPITFTVPKQTSPSAASP